MRCVVVCVLAGCAFHTHAGPQDGAVGDALDATAIDSSIDARPDAPREPCMAQWLDHTISFGAGVAITELNSSGYERDPYLSPDEKTVYFSSARSDSLPTGGDDIYTATRTTVPGTFTLPIKYAAASTTTGSETKMSITMDGKYLVVGSSQNGGAGGIDVWEATAAAAFAFGPLGRGQVMMLEDAGNQQDPMISASGLHLYEAPDTTGMQILAMASRNAPNQNFGAPVAITELNDATNGTADPTVNADETVIVFSSGRAGSQAGDLWYSTRASVSDTWGTPMLVPGAVNTTANEGDPHLGTDGCRLYFGSDRDSGQDWDLFVATAQ